MSKSADNNSSIPISCQRRKDCLLFKDVIDVDCQGNFCRCDTNVNLTYAYKCTVPSKRVTTSSTPTTTTSTIRNSADHTDSIPLFYFIAVSGSALILLALMFRMGRKLYKKRDSKNKIQASVNVANIAEESNILYLKTQPTEECESTEYRTISSDDSSHRRYAKDPTTKLVYDPPPAPILNRNNITDLEKIGEGCFGVVYKGCLRLQLPSIEDEDYFTQKVAMKTLKENSTSEAEEDFWKEVDIMSSFRHPNILSLLGICLRENDKPPCMIFEFMQYGDLAKVLRNDNRQFWAGTPETPVLTKDDLLDIALQIANGMEYLASQRYVHRDLACRNCLLGSNVLGGLEAKISDFGLSRDVYINDYYRVGTHLRTLPIRWMSPESIVYGTYNVESDIWSYGVVLWEIYSYGRQPYYGYSNEEVLSKITNGSISLDVPQNCPEEVADIMRSCWKRESKERIRFSEICRLLSSIRENLKNRTEVIAINEPANNELPYIINYAYETGPQLIPESNLVYV